VQRSYCYVAGESLGALLVEVRAAFLRPRSCESERRACENTLTMVAVELFDERPAAEQLAIIGDLLHRNPSLALPNEGPRDMFAHARVAGDYLVDLVCGAVSEVLRRDPVIANEDDRRNLLTLRSAQLRARIQQPPS